MPDAVSLREIDLSSVRTVCALSVREDQRRFVAPNAISMAEAAVSDVAWFRAVNAGDEPVGFVMLDVGKDGQPPFLWRFMIDAAHQRRGLGRRALGLLVDHVRSTFPAARELLTSVVEGEGGPKPFYLGAGFEDTGRREDGETVLRLPLGGDP